MPATNFPNNAARFPAPVIFGLGLIDLIDLRILAATLSQNRESAGAQIGPSFGPIRGGGRFPKHR